MENWQYSNIKGYSLQYPFRVNVILNYLLQNVLNNKDIESNQLLDIHREEIIDY